MTTAGAMIYLCKCSLRGLMPEAERLAGTDLNKLYQLASLHKLASMTGLALEKAGIRNENFHKAIATNYYKTLLMDSERKKIFQALEEKEIWHVALKGAELKAWYPKEGMRESVDLDVLFDERYEKEVRDVMVGLGYTVDEYGGGHHDVYSKSMGITVEMHLALFGVEYEERLNRYFANVRERLIERKGLELCFKPEDFYVYFIAHNHNHFVNGGIGIRSLTDTYVFLQKFGEKLDWTYVETELKKINADQYERENRSLTEHLFAKETTAGAEREVPPEDEWKTLTAEDREMLNYLIGSGAHGTAINKVRNVVNRSGGGMKGRLSYIWQRLFLPMDVVKHGFPFFYRHKILLPFLPIYRTIKGLTGNKKKLDAEWDAFRQL